MLSNQTAEKLTRLKLPAMAESYRRLSENPDRSELSFDDLFGMIVDAEWTARHNKRLKRLLKSSGMPQSACMEDMDYKPDRKLGRQIITTLSECGWIQNRHNLIITGSTGTGKTYLSCAFGNMACRLGYSVKYLRLPRLLTDLNIAKTDGSYDRILNQLKKCSLLILDDWGLAEISAADSRDILEVIETRMSTGSTILSAQIPVANWFELFADPTLADACLDRLVHNAYRIEIEGDSMRKILAEKELSKDGS
jgi:DNA replication protein DnaC